MFIYIPRPWAWLVLDARWCIKASVCFKVLKQSLHVLSGQVCRSVALSRFLNLSQKLSSAVTFHGFKEKGGGYRSRLLYLCKQYKKTFVCLKHAEALNLSLLLFKLHYASLSDEALFQLKVQYKTLHTHFINPHIAYCSSRKHGCLTWTLSSDTTSKCRSPASVLLLTLHAFTPNLLKLLMAK